MNYIIRTDHPKQGKPLTHKQLVLLWNAGELSVADKVEETEFRTPDEIAMLGESDSTWYTGEKLAELCEPEEALPKAQPPVSAPIMPPPVQPTDTEGPTCPHCGSTKVGRARGLQGGESLACALLFFCFVIPGILYYIFVEAQPYCSGCGKRVTPHQLKNRK